MPKRSAGVLLYRKTSEGLEVLLAHPGGPFWMNRDKGAWSIPKGEFEETEDAQAAARRELLEETGIVVSGPLMELGTYRQPNGKRVSAWAVEDDFDPSKLKSNSCEVEWPPKSGRSIEVPEIDRVAWFSLEEALAKVTRGQVPILRALAEALVSANGNAEKEFGTPIAHL